MAATAETIPSPTHPDVARIDEIVAKQRAFFDAGETLSLEFRHEQLRALLNGLEKHTDRLREALYSDLHKSEAECVMTEYGLAQADVRHAIKHVAGWMRRRSTGFGPMLVAPARGYIQPQPLGLNLIIGPWNYPLLLVAAPLSAALAAGNVAVVKPPELAPATSAATAEMLRDAFDERVVAVVEGGVEASKALLARKWDHYFFTGGTEVGRIVARAAAEHLARATLELGGKSPAIVTASADVDVAARRIVRAKFNNLGQTCIAPDYVLAEASIHDALLDGMKAAIETFYGQDLLSSPDLGRVINERHFRRLLGLLDQDKVFCGGGVEESERFIEPTVLRDVTLDDAVMGEEIFGPLLPVMKVDSLEGAMGVIAQRPDPLALYLFTGDGADETKVVERVSFGGGCINDAAFHFYDNDLPFGGIRNSGVGAYHGQHGFDRFSHLKAVHRAPTWLDPALKYPPFAPKLGIIKKVL